MPKRSKASEVGLANLRRTTPRVVRTDDIPELNGDETPVIRDAAGQVPRSGPGPVRKAILESLDNRGMTRYSLWKKAQIHCATLSRSAVYEYLRGARDIGIEYAEALMAAANLKIVARGSTEEQGPKARRRS